MMIVVVTVSKIDEKVLEVSETDHQIRDMMIEDRRFVPLEISREDHLSEI